MFITDNDEMYFNRSVYIDLPVCISAQYHKFLNE